MKMQCWNCKEIIYDAKDIQPILHYNKMKSAKNMPMTYLYDLSDSVTIDEAIAEVKKRSG